MYRLTISVSSQRDLEETTTELTINRVSSKNIYVAYNDKWGDIVKKRIHKENLNKPLLNINTSDFISYKIYHGDKEEGLKLIKKALLDHLNTMKTDLQKLEEKVKGKL